MPRKRTLPLLAAAVSLVTGAPAAAQVDHSTMPGMSMPMPAKKAPAKKVPAKQAKKAPAKAPARNAPLKQPSAKKPSAKAPLGNPAARTSVRPKPVATPPPRQPPAQAADAHAGHDMSAMPGMAAPDGAGPAAKPGEGATAADPHAGHDMGAMPGMTVPAAGMPDHEMGAMDQAPVGTALPAGNASPPPAPADHAGDAIYGAQAMDMGRHHLAQFHGGQRFSYILANILETRVQRGRDGYEWDAKAWYGGDINRLTIKSQGEGTYGASVEKAEVQALYNRAIDPYFNLQAGLRYDFKPNPSRAYAVVAVEGLAPNFFDVEGSLFLSDRGELMARLEGLYDQRITQRLILQPKAEINFAAQGSRDIAVGSGLSSAELGLRLRYDIRREFAPYVGLSYRRAFGETRRFLEAEGERASGLSFVAGVRMWF